MGTRSYARDLEVLASQPDPRGHAAHTHDGAHRARLLNPPVPIGMQNAIDLHSHVTQMESRHAVRGPRNGLRNGSVQFDQLTAEDGALIGVKGWRLL